VSAPTASENASGAHPTSVRTLIAAATSSLFHAAPVARRVLGRVGADQDPGIDRPARLILMTKLGEPAMIGNIHHIGLTVRNVDASAAWYVEVLGFRRVGEFSSPDGTRRKVFLRHNGLQARLGLTEHRHGGKDLFDETRVGLDHLAFAVADQAELDAWSARLTHAAVVHSSVVSANSIPGASVLVFRDPDNIQLEFFADPSDTMDHDAGRTSGPTG
jgi:glyoxylase I family protein